MLTLKYACYWLNDLAFEMSVRKSLFVGNKYIKAYFSPTLINNVRR